MIVAASDLHLGKLVRKERLASWIQIINDQNPDLIMFVGDIFDKTFRSEDSQGMISEFNKLKSKYGVYAIVGNHEYYFDINKSIEYLKLSGIHVLIDEVINIENKITVIGRDDAHNLSRKALDLLIEKLIKTFQ